MSATAAVKSVLAPAVSKVNQKPRLTALSLAAGDTVAITLAAALSLAIFQLWFPPWNNLVIESLPGLSTLFVFAVLGLYPVIGLNPALEFRKVILGSAAGHGLGTAVIFLRQAAPLSACARYAAACLATIVLVFVCRSTCRALCAHQSWWGTPAILFGSGREAQAIFRTLQRHSTGLKVVAAFDRNPINWPELDHNRVHVSTPEYASEFAAQHGVAYAIIAKPGLTGAEIGTLIKQHAACFRHVLVLPGLSGLTSVRVEARAVAGMLGLHVKQTLLCRQPQLIKRALDLCLAPLALAALLPFFTIIYLAVRLSSRGPVFYGHTRIGHANSTFKAWKFRTMHPNADQILATCLENDPELRREWAFNHKLKNDPRVTSIGKFLRKTSLDELPQLWNVLRGDMSFVGPRPIVSAEASRYGDCFASYSSVRPGITGLWQVSGRNNTTYDERVELDEHYVRNWSVWLDLYILSRTIQTVLLGEGAY